MSTVKSHAKKTATHAETTDPEETETMTTPMTTQATAHESNPQEVTSMSTSTVTENPSTIVTAPATPTPAQGATTVLSLAAPPADANIPKVPAEAVPTDGADYAAALPIRAEQAALPAAVADLQKFVTYTQQLGPTAPPVAHLIQLLILGMQWTGMRNATSAWNGYSRTQEGMIWIQIRAAFARLKPAFDLATLADPTITTQLPGLVALLGVKSATARKAVQTKRANKKAEAEGKPATHGKVGKSRKNAAKNAAYAAAQAAPATPVAAPVEAATTPVTPATPAVRT